jgi:hypothetical protein
VSISALNVAVATAELRRHQQETLRLMELARRFDLRFVVIEDHYNSDLQPPSLSTSSSSSSPLPSPSAVKSEPSADMMDASTASSSASPSSSSSSSSSIALSSPTAAEAAQLASLQQKQAELSNQMRQVQLMMQQQQQQQQQPTPSDPAKPQQPTLEQITIAHTAIGAQLRQVGDLIAQWNQQQQQRQQQQQQFLAAQQQSTAPLRARTSEQLQERFYAVQRQLLCARVAAELRLPSSQVATSTASASFSSSSFSSSAPASSPPAGSAAAPSASFASASAPSSSSAPAIVFATPQLAPGVDLSRHPLFACAFDGALERQRRAALHKLLRYGAPHWHPHWLCSDRDVSRIIASYQEAIMVAHH